MKRLIVLICLLLLASGYVYASDECTFGVKFINNTDNKVVYLLNWVSHPYKYFKSINMAGGELDPGESIGLENKYKCGTYYVRWSDDNTNHIHAFTQTVSETKILTPNF